MTAHRLFVGREPSPRVTQNDFVWPEVGREGSLRTSIGPDGRELATASLPVIDLLRLGVAVYLVDRTTRRPRDWSRDLELSLPVSDPVAWSVRANAVAGLLDFLTGDRWDLTFRQGPTIPITRAVAERRSEHDLVSLFSGGMDSFAGAALALRTAERPLLVGHWNWAPTSGMQAAAHEALRELTGATPEFRAVHVGRRSVQINGTPFGEERTSRSRSLLFIAIGVAVATGTRARELWIPENGWVSLNVPLDGSRRCTLSTRTTHPGLIHELNGLLRDLGIDLAICNPWGGRTKGDLVRWVAERWDPAAASAAFTATNSCARSDMRFLGQHPNAHCGVCYACLVRRGAFIAAGVVDATPYVEEMLRADPAGRERFMRSRGRDLAAVRGALARGGFVLGDVLALDLPVQIPPNDALVLADRGLQELAAVDLP